MTLGIMSWLWVFSVSRAFTIFQYFQFQQKGIAKNFGIRFLYMQKAFAKILLFAFLFFESKIWKIGPIGFHINILKVKSRNEIVEIAAKKLDNHNFCLLFMGPFVRENLSENFL